MNQKASFRKATVFSVLPLFIPWAIVELFLENPGAQWWTAWSSSWLIFAMCWSGILGGVDFSVPFRYRILNPIYLSQGIFAGYGFLTAIFAWLDVNGISFMDYPPVRAAERFETAATVQTYYLLAHASLAAGMLLAGQRGSDVREEFRWRGSLTALLILISIFSTILGMGLSRVGPLVQFGLVFSHLGMVCGVSALGPSLRKGQRKLFPLALAICLIYFAYAISSGWKHEVLVLLILVSLALFTRFPKTTVLFAPPVFAAALVILPVLVNHFREESWQLQQGREVAFRKALESLETTTMEEYKEVTWTFLSDRLSEAEMAWRYFESVELGREREGLQILLQTLYSPIPKAIWSGKPPMEVVAMQRAYNHDVVSRFSRVSAKPHAFVDAYLMGGRWGVFFSFLVIGLVASGLYVYCCRHFGGPFLGGVFFNGIFAVLWRGNCFEFMGSTLFWSAVVMFGIVVGCRAIGVIASSGEAGPSQEPVGLLGRDPGVPEH